MDALEALRTRRSIRKFRPEPVAHEAIEAVVDCGRLAASAINRQPWDFVVVTDETERRLLAEIADYGKFIAEAPVCIVVLCREGDYAVEDGAAATQNMLVAARALGLGTCWVAGHGKSYADGIRKMVGAPDSHIVISLIALGRPDQTPQPEKRPLKDVLHWDRF